MNLRQWARRTRSALNDRPAAERPYAYSAAQVEDVLRMAVDVLIDLLAEGEELRIDALGRLWVEAKTARRLVSNLGSASLEYTLSDRRVVRFRPSSRLRAWLNSAPETPAPTGDSSRR
jgi:nucleoid DNA-binding protein